ncbi:MAG: ArnT family glycosyltransferase [Acidimicrobiales bacterium]
MTIPLDAPPSGPPLVPPPPGPGAAASPGADPGASRRSLTDGLADRAVPLSVAALLVGTAVLYLWGLSASGYANSFYSAAAQAGSESWKAFFFGSLDAGNAITVDKPPASLWLMGLSVRIFGLSSWSILVPEALLGVASVATLYAAVRRVASHWAGILAGVALAITPAAALMFRFNNPDALLVCTITLAAYFVIRALDGDHPLRWMVWAGVACGIGFLSKSLQVVLVLPALSLPYLIAARGPILRRVGHLLAAGAAMVVTLGWWVAVVELVPASARPYIGGSQNNSVLDLIFGYNGLGRINGDEVGSVTGGGGAAAGGPGAGPGVSMWGQTGITRMFDGVSGGMIAWLVPAALILTVAGLWVLRRRPRTDLTRAGLILMSTWMIVTGLVFSFMQGIYHDYYTVALAPPIAGTVAIGAWAVWQHRADLVARLSLAAAMAATTGWAWVLLDRAPDSYRTLQWAVAGLGTLATTALIGSGLTVLAGAAVTLAVTAALGGPAAYALDTVTTPHTGSIVTAGPVADDGPGGGGPGGGFGGQAPGDGGCGGQGPGGGGPGGAAPPIFGPTNGTATNGTNNNGTAGGPQFGGAVGLGGGGGLLDGPEVSTELASLLTDGAADYAWVAATTGAQNAAGYQLATGDPVLAIGGFNGSDPSPTLAQFQQWVADGRIHYYLAGGQIGPSNGGANTASEIESWVTANYTGQTVGSTTVYDLSGGR